MSEEMYQYKEDKDWGWKRASEFFGIDDPFLKKVLFVEEYDISSNIYLIEDDGLNIIDPGNDYTAYYELFNRMGYNPDDVKRIFLTHGHREHIAGFFEFVRSYPYLIYEGKLTLYLHEDAPEELQFYVKDMKCKYEYLKGAQKIKLGEFELEVIYTPGHTIDSVCFYEPTSKSIFTGDTVLPYAVASPDPIGGGRIDYHLFSLKILMNMDIKHLFPGHGTPVAERAKEVFEGNYAGIIKKIVGLEVPWVEGAKFLASKGYLEECIFCCDRDLKENPDNVLALSLKGSCLSDLGRFEEAEKTFDEVLKRVPDSVFALCGKGYALMGQKRYDEALRYFESALRIDPKSTTALIYKAMALYLSGRVEEALEIKEFREEFAERFKEELEKTKNTGKEE